MTTITKVLVVGIVSLLAPTAALAVEPVATRAGTYQAGVGGEAKALARAPGATASFIDAAPVGLKAGSVADAAPAKVGEPINALPARLTSGPEAGFKAEAVDVSPAKGAEAAGSLPTRVETGAAGAYRSGVNADPSAVKAAPSTGPAGVSRP